MRVQTGVHGDGTTRSTAVRGLDRRPVRRAVRRGAGVLAAVLSVLLVAAGCTSDSNPRPKPDPTPASASRPHKPVALTFGVFGPPAEVDAFRGVVDAYNAVSDDSHVTVRAWSSHAALRAALESGQAVPDVFLASRNDLAWLREQQLTQPVDNLLDERGVDFGDGYSRDALEAYSFDNRLQCMPYGISPTVIFYNTRLVNFDAMAVQGIDVPTVRSGTVRWNFDQFASAAAFATRPARHTRGLYVPPTLRGLAPFIYSGGGSLYDDAVAPTSLTFSDGDTQSALERTLRLLRDPHLTLTEKQLRQASPQEWFERGRLGMMEGDRSLVPELRKVHGLRFDVMPMPVLDSYATVGDFTGLCLSRQAASTPEAADFLVNATSAPSVTLVTRAGYLAPANLEVALSDAFLQEGLEPEHASVFNSVVRTLKIPPLLDSAPALQRAVAPDLRELVTVPVLDDLETITQRIDDTSRTVLAPPSASPSP
jgi:multiple sugar transport system substrate-binding protein